MKLVTHSRQGKINEKGGGDETRGSGLYANQNSFDMQHSCS